MLQSALHEYSALRRFAFAPPGAISFRQAVQMYLMEQVAKMPLALLAEGVRVTRLRQPDQPDSSTANRVDMRVDGTDEFGNPLETFMEFVRRMGWPGRFRSSVPGTYTGLSTRACFLNADD